MTAVYGDRIRQARELRRLTQSSLADTIGIKQPTLSQFEAGQAQPSPRVLEAVAFATGFPPSFFHRAPGADFPLGSLLFRTRRVATVRDIAEAHRWCELLYECAASLAIHFERMRVSVPQLNDVTPTEAARLTRSAVDLSPDKPISNLTHTLEKHGVMVLVLPVQLPGRDAFSTWVDRRTPLIALAHGAPGDRVRFSLAHELGHLVMHVSQRGTPGEIEREANRFAAEFLLPKVGIRDELAPTLNLENFGRLKRRWGVAIQALILRARDLNVISSRRAEYLFKLMTIRGYREHEPEQFSIPVEKPRALRKMAELVYGDPVEPRKLAVDFDVPISVASTILALHAERHELMTTVPDDDDRPGNVVRFRSQH